MNLRRFTSLALSLCFSLGVVLYTSTVLADPSAPRVSTVARTTTSPVGARSAATPTPPTPPPLHDGVVNINTASADELTRLPGVGPTRADAIVRLRERVRRFSRLEDLRRVRGIGRVTLHRMRPYLTLQGDTTLTARPGRAPRPLATAQ